MAGRSKCFGIQLLEERDLRSLRERNRRCCSMGLRAVVAYYSSLDDRFLAGGDAAAVAAYRFATVPYSASLNEP